MEIIKILKFYFKSYSGINTYIWRRVALSFLVNIATASCLFIALYLVNSLGFNIIKTGIVLSLYGLGRVIGGFISASLYGNFLITTEKFALIFLIALFLTLAFSSSFVLVSSILFFIGLANYLFVIANRSWILSVCSDKSGVRFKCINVLYSFDNLGIGISSLIMGLVSKNGFHYIFILSAVILLISLILLFFITGLESKKTIGKYLTKNVEEEKNSQHKNNKIIAVVTLISLFFISLLIAQRQTVFGVYIYEYLSMTDIGILYAINPLLIVLLQVPFTTSIHKKSLLLILGVGALLIGLGLFILIFSKSFFVGFISCVIYTFGEMLFMPTSQIALYKRIERYFVCKNQLQYLEKPLKF